MGIFKAYDVRGLVPEELTADAAERIGGAAARFFGAGAVAVGRDARTHSPILADALVAGMRRAGADVVDLGLVATPMLYFGVDRLGLAGGVMVTASHNPAAYNGFKVCGRNAVPVGEASGLREIERLAGEAAPAAARAGGLRREDVRAAYVEHLLALTPARPALRVAIDCGNGMAGVGLEPLLARLPLTVERLYFEPDGRFPNHPADPLVVENLADVREAVRRTGAQLGVALDGDGDRAIFVDERAEPVASDLVTALLARAVLARQPGATILYDLRSSRAVAEEIRAAGGVPEMCRVGHSFVKKQMRERGAPFGGELSGHFYFRFSETLVADDGSAALMALLDVLDREKRPLSQLVKPLQRYAASGEISRRVPDVGALLRAIESDHRGSARVSHLDGLLVEYPDWWFNLRPSNTEPVLRLNLEARDPARMAAERDRLVARMEAGA
ncbi:MAG TPA: phosphomannomutase/phosphoglucomutase [Myxococcota bacterium]|nr:phosphomannomutase/phosphoglucomutase [Myxococcota bacterium]